MEEKSHIPVLPEETLDLLNLEKGDVVIDATLGLGGHSLAIVQALGPRGILIAFDQDESNLNEAKKRLKDHKNIHFVHSNFEHLKKEVKNLNLKQVDAVLFDLGISSVHVDEAERGFAFKSEGPLDMRYDRRQSLTAEEVVNTYSEKDLTEIIKAYGEDRRAPVIARKIVEVRKSSPIETTAQLAEIIKSTARGKQKIHPATQTFQALRIYVNRELEVLKTALEDAISILAPGGRIAVISYHSLEDRIVKNFFKENADTSKKQKYQNKTSSDECQPETQKSLYILTKKPIIPSGIEVLSNPRARSAKLRVAKRI